MLLNISLKLCNNSDQTLFSNTLTFARSLGSYRKPRPSASVFNTSLGSWQTLMHKKPCLILIVLEVYHKPNYFVYIYSSVECSIACYTNAIGQCTSTGLARVVDLNANKVSTRYACSDPKGTTIGFFSKKKMNK